jgi:hypothetical protein
MKRLIAALGVGWGLIYATNHLLLPHAPTESKVAVQSEQTSTNRSINSWGPYLPHVKHPEPNKMAQTSLKSHQIQDHAVAVALEERTLQVARVENPPTSAAYQHDRSQSSLQDLKPNSEAVALEERTVRIARVENPPMAAVRHHDGIQLSSRDLKPNSEAVASEERTLHAGSRPAGTASIARVEEHRPIASGKTKGPRSVAKGPRSVAAAKARVAEVTADQHPSWPRGSAPQRRGVGLFMFAPPGF